MTPDFQNSARQHGHSEVPKTITKGFEMSKNQFDKPDHSSAFEQSLEVKTNSEVAAELAALELEEKRLDLELKREQVAKIRAQREAKLEETRAKLRATLQFIANRKMTQDNCNHHKGGTGAAAVVNGQGTSAMYCISKFKKPNGKWFVLCMRCGKEWHQGFPLLGEVETPGFLEVIQWPTDNTPAASSTFLFERTA